MEPTNSRMKLLGHIPSPYGVPLSVFEDPTFPEGSDESYRHSIDDCMTIAGIHAPGDRDRCRIAIKAAMGKGGVPFEIFLQHGGRKVPREPIGRPAEPIYPKLPRNHEMDIPIENWVTLVLDHSRWDERAAALLDVIGGNTEAASGWGTPPEVLALGLQHLLTAALEHLAEAEIDCLEAAAIYACCLHDEWSEPAVRWLEPVRSTWFADWIAERPGYRAFARLCRSVNPDLPSWIGGGE